MRATALHLAVLVLFAAFLVVGVAPASAEGPIENVTVFDANGTEVGSATEIEAAIENGSIRRATTVLVNSTLVVRIQSPGLTSDLDDDSSVTQQFFDVLDDDALHLQQINNNYERNPKIARLGPRNTTVRRTDSTTYALIDTGALRLVRPGSQEPTDVDFHPDDTFEVVLGYNLENATANGYFSVTPTPASIHPFQRFELLPTAVVERDVDVYVRPADQVSVSLHLATGQTRIKTLDPSRTGTTHPVRFDLRDVPDDTNYTIAVNYNGTVVDRVSGTIREARAVLEDVRINRTTAGFELRFDAVLSHGGHLLLQNEYGWRLGRSNFEVTGLPQSPGNRSTVTLSIDVVPTDRVVVRAMRDDDEESFYRNPESRFSIYPENGTVSTSAPPLQTPGPTPTATPPSTPDRSTTRDETSTDATPPTTSGADGTGPIGVVLSVLGLLGLGLAVWRRR